jgi:Cu2+-exporting ATPase
VYQLLHSEGLERFYDLRGARGVPVPEAVGGTRDTKWLEAYEGQLSEGDGLCQVGMDLQGIHCAACVWLVQELFDKRGGANIVVNPALGRVDMTIDTEFPLRDFVADVERFGYVFGPAIKKEDGAIDELLLRTGIAIALAGNTMLFAAAIHLGLAEGPLFVFMHQVSYALAVVSVLVGGSVFFRGAIEGLRRGVLHLDVPIAIGIALAFGGSSWSFFFGEARAVYFDSLTVFVALMLLGRFLTERALAANRRRLLSSDGAESLSTRRVANGRVELIRCTSVGEADELLIAPGDLVPVDARLDSETATVSLSWIDGESRPRHLREGAIVPAGAFNVGRSALSVVAQEGFASSSLGGLLRSTRADDGEGYGRGRFWQRVSTVYVIGVLLAAGAGLAFWTFAQGDGMRGLEVAIAVLVVTCPCAFGIATPMAYELVLAGLRRAGLFVRRAGFLDRARRVKKIVFDKTGTLTTAALELEDPTALGRLDEAARAALYDLSARSSHPKSEAVKRALDDRGLALRPEVAVLEHPGQGLEAAIDGHLYRLGAPGWLLPADEARQLDDDLVFVVDHELCARLSTREKLRPDAEREIARLSEDGYELSILSGDDSGRVQRMARELGIPEARAVGDQRPEDKAAWVRAHDDGDTLMVGDGINDAMAVDGAFCSGTPAIDRPFMPARSDFYFVTPGLGPLTLALRASGALAHVVRRNLTFAVLYNVGAVSLAWAGLMQPWVAAVLMPTSSLLILAFTTWSLSKRSPLWRS